MRGCVGLSLGSTVALDNGGRFRIRGGLVLDPAHVLEYAGLCIVADTWIACGEGPVCVVVEDDEILGVIDVQVMRNLVSSGCVGMVSILVAYEAMPSDCIMLLVRGWGGGIRYLSCDTLRSVKAGTN